MFVIRIGLFLNDISEYLSDLFFLSLALSKKRVFLYVYSLF